VDDAVVVSFVATRVDARGHGLASLVTVTALADARNRGAAVAALQAIPQAERLYQRLGFVPVGSWQEWTSARPASAGG
jgi:predicted acetyltransferase